MSAPREALKATLLAGLRMAARLSPLPGGHAVLCYHRLTRDWLNCGLAPHIYVHADRFREHLRILRRNAELIGLAELDKRLAARRESPPGRDEPEGLAVCVTFDDGYADNLSLALPILKEEGVPAALFVSTGFVDDPADVPWWDVNFRAAREIAQGVVHLRDNGRSLRFDTRTMGGRRGLLKAMNDATLRRCRENGGRARPVAEEVFPDMARAERNDFCAWDDLRAALGDGLLTIGSHTVSHPVLSACADWETTELAASRERLEAELGERVAFFAYPYGGPAHIPADPAESFASQGIRLAMTITAGLNHASTDRYGLRRISVEGGDDAGGLLARIKAAMLRDRVRDLLPEAVEMFEEGRERTCGNGEEEACARRR